MLKVELKTLITITTYLIIGMGLILFGDKLGELPSDGDLKWQSMRDPVLKKKSKVLFKFLGFAWLLLPILLMVINLMSKV